MKGITIAWCEGPFRCEYRREPTGGWLQLLSGDDVVAREPVASVTAACTRARELSDTLALKRARPA